MVENVRKFLETPYGKGVISGIVCSFCVVFLVLLLFFCGYGRGNGGSCADSTVGSIGAYQQLARDEAANAGREISNAGQTVQRAGERIDSVQARIERGTELAQRNADLIVYLGAELKECRRLAEENQRIIDSVGKPAGSGTSQGQGR